MVMLSTSFNSTTYGYDEEKPHVTFFDTTHLTPSDVNFSSSLYQLRTAPPLQNNEHIGYQPSTHLTNISEVTQSRTVIPTSPDTGRKSRHRRPFKDLSRDLQCTEEGCERKYASKSSLSTHYRLKHSPEAKAKEFERLEAIRHKSEERRTPRPVRPRASPSNQNLELMRHKSAGSTVGVRDLSHPFYPVSYSSLTSPVNSYRATQTPPPQMPMSYFQRQMLFNTPSPGQPQRTSSLSFSPPNSTLYNQMSMPGSLPSSQSTVPIDNSLFAFKGTVGGFLSDNTDLTKSAQTPLEDQLLLQSTIDELWELGLGTLGDQFLVDLNPNA
ncbi:hypothetical protein SARC_12613 [Sphaeroforma arctica JP610]|uniref:C2H2-type domain-containing protein n=1 Tax=Sphaeroforma arctica JP610 TaxID=667725 RepID=A0A0L0FDK6_9EUKA|nr:hypothetical protein SARC_12613 [Sphaeroforma arctica JP610]KNC74847.1 hypothetical protein SARC_12613 [Sphaeroforma arctica JP610]|eukprot:XP_014148749.1 hypothetical protein SARC_12613 [Sphaeroforma arctica JP610]